MTGKRPKKLQGATYRINTGCGWLYITLNTKNNAAYEILGTIGKGGGCAASQIEAICRMTSLALQAGADIKELAKNLSSICCHSPVVIDTEKVTSCADAISKCLKQYVDESKPEEPKEVVKEEPK